jgi:hypothetical protein
MLAIREVDRHENGFGVRAEVVVGINKCADQPEQPSTFREQFQNTSAFLTSDANPLRFLLRVLFPVNGQVCTEISCVLRGASRKGLPEVGL